MSEQAKWRDTWQLEETENFISVLVGPGEDDGIAFAKSERDLAERIVADHNTVNALEARAALADEMALWHRGTPRSKMPFGWSVSDWLARYDALADTEGGTQ